MFPKLISIGSFYIPTYGVLVALGFLAGLALCCVWRGARVCLREDHQPGGLLRHRRHLGAKLFMFLFDLGRLHHESRPDLHPRNVAGRRRFSRRLYRRAFWWRFSYMRQQSCLCRHHGCLRPGRLRSAKRSAGSAALPPAAAGARECDLPWGVRFRSDFAAPVPLDKPLHPVQLYESAADLLIFALLYPPRYPRRHPAGQVIGLYLVLYSTARFIIEFFREHEQALVGPFSLTQWIALGCFVVGVAILLAGRQREVIVPQAIPG